MAHALCNLGQALRRQKKPAEAEKVLNESLAIYRKLGLMGNDLVWGELMPILGGTLLNLEKLPEAEEILREALTLCQNQQGDRHEDLVVAWGRLVPEKRN